MKLEKKLGIGVFLSLSVVIVVISIIRYTGYHLRAHLFDVIWLVFLIYLEASIAMIMASFVVFRTLFARRGLEPNEIKKRHKVRNLYLIHKFFPRKTDWEATDQEHLPKIPSETHVPRDVSRRSLINFSIFI